MAGDLHQLFEAVRHGNEAAVREMMTNLRDKEEEAEELGHVMNYAVEVGDVNVIRAMCDFGAHESDNEAMRKAVASCWKKKNVEALKVLCEYGAQFTDNRDYYALSYVTYDMFDMFRSPRKVVDEASRAKQREFVTEVTEILCSAGYHRKERMGSEVLQAFINVVRCGYDEAFDVMVDHGAQNHIRRMYFRGDEEEEEELDELLATTPLDRAAFKDYIRRTYIRRIM